MHDVAADAQTGTTPPVIAPGHTFATVTDKISSIVLARRTPRWWWIGFLIAFGLVIVGIASAIPLLATYITKGLALNGSSAVVNHVAVTGLGAAITGAQLFVSTLLLHGTIIATTRGRPTVRKRG